MTAASPLEMRGRPVRAAAAWRRASLYGGCCTNNGSRAGAAIVAECFNAREQTPTANDQQADEA